MKLTKFSAILATSILATSVVNANDWTGFYLGVEGGLAGAKADFDENYKGNDPDILENSDDFSVKGESATAFGITAGYDYQINSNFVVGGLASYTQVTYKKTIDNEEFSESGNFLDLGARAGYVVSPNLMVHASLGWTKLMHEKLDDAGLNPTGYSIGLGADYKLTDNWILSAQYKLRSVKETAESTSEICNPDCNIVEKWDSEAKLNTSTFTIGVAYKF